MKSPMTVNGAALLRAELERLNEERPRIIQAIAEAREHGDLKENAEYHAAREQQSFVEGRVREIESRLASAQIIDITCIQPSGRVIFGTTVQLHNMQTDELQTWRIVGEDEADVQQSTISVTSPLARAMISKQVGELISVTTPKGEVEYEIRKIEHL